MHFSNHEPSEELSRLEAFHGHLGPFVVAGLRLGHYAVRRLDAHTRFDLEVEVACPDAPPPSCVLDGLQFATGCTLGKRTISHRVAEGVTAQFRHRQTGERLLLRLRAESVARAVAALQAEGQEQGVKVVLELSEAELLEELPLPAEEQQ